eukprot:m51a1_g9843 hypothetical protein (412) ;mRNA; f:1956182-1957530
MKATALGLDAGDALVLRWAAASRLATAGASAVLGLAWADYDASAEGAAPALVRWDALYFARIAARGYEYEHYGAFFPGLPAALRALALPLAPALGVEGAVVWGGLLLSALLFCASALLLRRLGCAVLGDSALATRAALLYAAANPASVFLSSLYTESAFAFLSLAGLLLLARGRPWASAALFACATATRSNGILLCGFVVHELLADLLPLHLLLARWGYRPRPPLGPWAAARACASAAARCALVVAPYVGVAWWGARTFCAAGPRPGPPADLAWCEAALVPGFYGHVQRHYWHQGLLRYWTARQLPNFALAAPMFALAAAAAVDCLRARCGRALLGPALVHAAYWVLAVGFALVYMHVQVVTRFVCSAPALWWYAAWLTHERPACGRLVVAYGLCYALVGCLLFSNFYPWT